MPYIVLFSQLLKRKSRYIVMKTQRAYIEELLFIDVLEEINSEALNGFITYSVEYDYSEDFKQEYDITISELSVVINNNSVPLPVCLLSEDKQKEIKEYLISEQLV